MARIAYLILAHKDPSFIARVAKKVIEHTNNDVYIHVDLKTDITPFKKACEGISSIHFIEQRFKVYWGGYSSIEATIALFKSALKNGPYNHYMILQGADYPLWSNEKIDNYFEQNKDVEFIRAICDTKADKTQWQRYIPKYKLDGNNKFNKIYNHSKIILFRFFKQLYHAPYVDIDGKNKEIFRGWAHFALTQECVEYVVAFHESHPKFNKYFSHVYASDESYFHTIIYNSRFRKNTVENIIPEEKRSIQALCNLTYFEYPLYVTEFTKKEDYEYLLSKGYPFFRKCSSASSELLDEIDKRTKN